MLSEVVRTFLEEESHRTHTAVNFNSKQNLAGKTPGLPALTPSKSCLPWVPGERDVLSHGTQESLSKDIELSQGFIRPSY